MDESNQDKELEDLYLKYYKELFSVAIKITKNKENAEDVVNEVFYIALLKLDTLLNHPNKIAWLYKVLHFCIQKLKTIDCYRQSCNDDDKKQNKYVYNQSVCYDENEIKNIYYEANLFEGELFEDYKDILTETEFKYLIYKFEYDLNIKEISKLLNKSETSVTTLGFRIKKKIKNFINEMRSCNENEK